MEESVITKLPRTVVVDVTEELHVAHARRTARTVAEVVGFGKVLTCHVATSVSEIANNLVFHATHGGKIILSVITEHDRTGLQIEGRDTGPGIADIEAALQDGFSTNGGLGGGLPGVKRLMDEFEIRSALSSGTHVIARIWKPRE